MTGRGRQQRETLAWIVAASAAVSVCSGAETHAAVGLLAHPSAPALAAPPRSGGLVVWLSQVTQDVAAAWQGTSRRPSPPGLGGLDTMVLPTACLPDFVAEHGFMLPTSVPTPLHAWRGRFRDIDLPPPGR